MKPNSTSLPMTMFAKTSAAREKVSDASAGEAQE